MKELEPKMRSARGREYVAHFLKGELFPSKKEKNKWW